MLVFTKRSLEAGAERNTKLSLKVALGREWEPLEEAELKHRIKVMQYEALVVEDVKEFRRGQIFQQFTEQSLDGIPRYNLIVRDAQN